MIKYLWIDTETTGLDPVKNDIVQIAGLIEVSGKFGHPFNYFCQPLNWEDISEDALKCNGHTIDSLKQFPAPNITHAEFKKFLFKYVNPFDPEDKLVLAGQNVDFDNNMIHQFCLKQGDKFWPSCVTSGRFDLKTLAVALEVFRNKKIFHSYALGNICKVLGVTLENAHDAMADIMAARECCLTIWNEITK